MKLTVSKLRVRNFKAIIDSGPVRLSPLTVFIGNNGSGKSSLIEALGLFKRLAAEDVDEALAEFRGLAHVRHKQAEQRIEAAKGKGKILDAKAHQLCLEVSGSLSVGATGTKRRSPQRYSADVCIAATARGNGVIVATHSVKVGASAPKRGVNGPAAQHVQSALRGLCTSWQFLDLEPRRMREPRDRRLTKRRVLLFPSGSNLAEYLLEMREGYGEEGRAAFDGLLDAMRQVLPYASDLQPVERDFLERKVFLELTEGTGERGFKVPGWLLSTGTLRIAALLAVLRHPEPPPLVCIEEIENGLDPRTIQLLVSEIQYAVERRGIQVVVTTHSPYFLDLVPLDTVVFVERGEKGPSFTRPADNAELRGWAEKFSPGQLYTMNTMTGSGSKAREPKP